jgi:hypothetical protein
MGAFFLKNENAIVWIPNLDNYLIKKNGGHHSLSLRKNLGISERFFIFKKRAILKA